jgi:hypothetical protein
MSSSSLLRKLHIAGKRNFCRLYRRQRSGIGSKAKKLICALAYCTILDHLKSR